MTITVRIQYKGDAARKLAAEEGNDTPVDPPRYIGPMERALSHFSIPPPHSSRAIWKSGFILCNWNITRDSSLFDTIFRGATRAQSIACKGTLENLSISFIHLFENSKPIRLSHNNGRNNSNLSLIGESSSDTVVDRSPLLERKRYTQYKSYNNHKYGPPNTDRDPATSGESLRAPAAPEIPASDSFDTSSSRRSSVQGNGNNTTYMGRSYATQEAVRSGPLATAPDTEVTLRRLAESQTLLALLGKGSGSEDVRGKLRLEYRLSEDSREPQRSASAVKEEVLSPGPLHTRPFSPRGTQQSPTPMRPSAERAFPPSTLSNLERSIAKPTSIQDDMDCSSQKWAARDDRPYQRSDRHDRDDIRGPTEDISYSKHRRSTSPISRRLSVEGDRGSTAKTPKLDRYRRNNTNPFYAREQQFETTDNGYKRHTFHSGDNATVSESFRSTGTKRPLSPNAARHDLPFTPYVKRHHPISPVAAEAAAARRSTFQNRPHNPPPVTRRSASPTASKSWAPGSHKAPSGLPEANGPQSSAAIFSKEGRDAPIPSRQERINTLNRDLWDVRRQLTALKAREQTIAQELKDLHVPVPADPAAVTAANGLAVEERLKGMEVELNSLRERLEREKERRRLVEEACETERKRRKLAEDILDDTRRETSAPMMIPAMMDAFEKIAQLTGDALNKEEE